MKTTKKIFALLLALVCVISCVSGCGNKNSALAKVKKAGKLTIATSPDFPPFEYLDGQELKGLEVELVELICKKLGVKAEFTQMDFDSVLAAIPSGKYNVGMSGISVTPGRQENALFSDPYCMAAQAIVVVEGSPITCKADLTGKTIAVQTATTAEEYCMENKYDVKAFNANNDAELALTQGKVDAWVIDDLTAAEMVAEYNKTASQKLVVLSEAMTSEPYALMFAKGADDLVAEVNKILADMLKDGTVKGLFEKYNAPYTAPSAK